jgi:hypothetical protein
VFIDFFLHLRHGAHVFRELEGRVGAQLPEPRGLDVYVLYLSYFLTESTVSEMWVGNSQGQARAAPHARGGA